MKGGERTVEWSQFLGVRPVRTVVWEEVDGRVVIVRGRPEGTGWRRWIGRLRSLLASPRVRLDDLGSFCWARFDGERDLGTIAGELEDEFGDRAADAEERVVRFARSLAGEGWIDARSDDRASSGEK